MKTIRLIELFAGYGSQAMALKRLGLPFEHHFVCEFDKYAVKSYNAVHGTNIEPIDIKDVKAADLNIVERDKYNYLLTYSFPCTDLSIAGAMQGMKKGSGTRSGLLWEVERLLRELGDNLPQYLLMENVTQVHGQKNIKEFQAWINFLDSLGYKSKWEDLNAKDYGVAQNRDRCFMVSWLESGFCYQFPQPIPLTKTMSDYLDSEVDDHYYLKGEKVERLIADFVESGTLERERVNKQSTSTQTPQSGLMSPQVSKQSNEDSIRDGAKNRELLSANYNEIRSLLTEAKAICSRDWRGFSGGTQCQNGVLESEEIKD